MDNKQIKCCIGVRESDINFAKNHFQRTVCLFSSNPEKQPFTTRLNQNLNHKDIFPFYQRNVLEIHNEYPNCSFMFYNQLTAYNYPSEIIQKSVCLNTLETLSLLNDKLSLKKWLSDHKVPIIKYETFFGKDISFKKLKTYYKGYDSFVIQESHGGGGVGTYRLDNTNKSEVILKLNSMQEYIVSPYIESISANTHVFISNDKTVLTPGSIQIVELKDNQLLYSGCDYITFRHLSNGIRGKIKSLSLEIAKLLKQEKYYGVAGIDFIIDKTDNVYCAEINPRFQASTLLIDLFLHEKKLYKEEASSTYELNEMAFNNCVHSSINYEDEINYSCYYYYNKSDTKSTMLKYNIFKDLDLRVYEDGLKYYFENEMLNNNSYLFKVVFPHAICGISPDCQLWINDNIIVSEPPKNIKELKVSLLNQGVRIKGETQKIKTGVYESVDILLKPNTFSSDNVHINCAFNINLSLYSPYIIKGIDNSTLYYYNKKVSDIIIEKDRLAVLSKPEKEILYLATDRLRIKMINGCENKNNEKNCKFCNLPLSNKIFSIQEIKNSLIHLKKENIQFRHILIGGGTSYSDTIWDNIIELCHFLKTDEFYKTKPISLMSIFPPIEYLKKLKDAGIEEVAFNLEIANESLAKKMMPGKRNFNKEIFYSCLQEAVEVYGVTNVRSALLVGLDKKEDTINEVKSLAKIGVLPCLSAFRPLPYSNFEELIGPNNSYLLDVYLNVVNMLKDEEYVINELGPKCIACRNNMLIV